MSTPARTTSWRKPPGLPGRESSRPKTRRDDSRPANRGRLRHIIPIALTLAAPFLLFAQDSTVLIKGLVLDAQTHKALAGAGVALSGAQRTASLTQTDAQGRFHLEVAEPGRYSIRANVSPYQPGGELLRINGSEKEVEVAIALNRSAVIAGRVTDHLGRPVVGGKVSAYSREVVQQGPGDIETAWTRFDSHSNYATSYYSGATDDRGDYRIWPLPKGEYVLLAKPPPDPSAHGFVRLRAAPAFYPNAEKFEEAGRLQLDWGEVDEGADIRLGPPSATRQSMRIIANPEGCPSCSVDIYRRGGEMDLMVTSARPAENGGLVLQGLSPGDYQIGAAYSQGIGPGLTGQHNFVIAEDGDHHFTLTLVPPVNLRGRVILEDAPDPLPEPPFKNPTFPQFDVVRIYNLPGEREKVFESCRSEATLFVGEGAERTFDALAAPGHCRLDARGPMNSYVAAITLDGRPLERSEILIPPNGLTGDLVVHIRFDMGEVAGRIEKAGEASWVFFLPAGEDKSGGYRTGKVETDGSFHAKLPPGSWQVLSMSGSSPYPILPQDVILDLPNLSGRLPRVEVRAGQTTAMTTPLEPQR